MLSSYRRGEETGTLIARNQPDMTTGDDPVVALWALAEWMFVNLSASGYAHMEPEREFVSGFVSGFVTARNAQVVISKLTTC